MTEATVSPGLAFLAGLASFLSPCVFPLVPSYLAFVTGLSLDELREGGGRVKRNAAVNAALFVLGFSLVFVALGASATLLGSVLRSSLPLLQRIGGAVIAGFGLYLLGVLRLPVLARERRVHLASRPVGAMGAVAAGVAFGAGWTPCIGPVLASILLYAGMEATMAGGVGLLAAYALGLGVPFFAAALAFNWFLGSARWVRRLLLPLERAAGAALVLVGALLATGHFASITAALARFAPPIQVGL